MLTIRLSKFAFAWLLVLAQSTIALSQIQWGSSLLKKDPDWYSSAEARVVANSVIQYQSPQGGWPKSTDLAKPPRTPADVPPPGQGRANSVDNEATTLPHAVSGFCVARNKR